MSELEDKINSILSSPDEMEKIMGIARSLSGTIGASSESSGDTPPAGASGLNSMASALGDIDPKMFKILSRLMGEYNSDKNDKSALLNAIKPYLRQERREAVDRAANIAKMAHVARIALSEFTGGDSGV